MRYITKRRFKNVDEERFRDEIRGLRWIDVYTSDKLTAVLDKFAPIRTIQVRSQYATWLSDATKLIIGQRNRAQSAASSAQDQDKWRFSRT